MSRETRAQRAEREEAVAKLREWIKPGDTVYTVLDHVSRSGMARHIRVVLLRPGDNGGAPIDQHPNYAVGRALGFRHAKRHGRELDSLLVGGCGMDMGFHVVSSLSRVLFPNGFGCIGRGEGWSCPSNDHNNGDRDYSRHVECAELDTTAGGYDHEATSAHSYYRETGRKCKRPVCHWHRSGDYAVRHRWL